MLVCLSLFTKIYMNMGGKVANGCLSCFIIWNVWVRLAKDQPRVLEENLCSLMQHWLVVCMNEADDDLKVSQRSVEGNYHPSLRKIMKSLVYLATVTLEGRGGRGVIGSTGRWSHHHPILRKIEGSLTFKVSDRDNGRAGRRRGCLSTHRRTVGEGRISLMDFNDFI